MNGDTIRLANRNTLCPIQGSIFLQTLKLVRQHEHAYSALLSSVYALTFFTRNL